MVAVWEGEEKGDMKRNKGNAAVVGTWELDSSDQNTFLLWFAMSAPEKDCKNENQFKPQHTHSKMVAFLPKLYTPVTPLVIHKRGLGCNPECSMGQQKSLVPAQCCCKHTMNHVCDNLIGERPVYRHPGWVAPLSQHLGWQHTGKAGQAQLAWGGGLEGRRRLNGKAECGGRKILGPDSHPAMAQLALI